MHQQVCTYYEKGIFPVVHLCCQLGETFFIAYTGVFHSLISMFFFHVFCTSQVESVCAALTSEVQELGRRNTSLEAAGKEAPTLREQCTALTKKNNVLLELLGEKTEALEELQADLDDVKKVYRTQLEQVMGNHTQQQPDAT